jgi:endonuclease/exonuclease/phosphatase family metal-dependent hydrolase
MPHVRIRIATYNVHKCRGLDRRTSPGRVAEVIAQLDADVVAIQEIVDAPRGRPEFDQARRIAGALPGYSLCFGENRPLHGGRYGNMTLSRLPVRFCENYDLTCGPRERRGCLRTDIVVGDKAIVHLFNAHLGTGFVERRCQAQRLLSGEVLHLGELRGPRIVAGDFNEWTRGLASRRMRDIFAVVEPRGFRRYRRTYPGVFPLLHLDHIYFDRALALESFRVHRSRKALVASDHLPIVAEFALPG